MTDHGEEVPPLESVIRDHQLVARHRCSCGWEGQSATTHIIDSVVGVLRDKGMSIIGGREAHYQGIDWDAGLYGEAAKECGNCGKPWPCPSVVVIGSKDA